MFKDKELEYVKRAFQIERDSYNNTIKYLRGKVDAYEAAIQDETTDDLANETIKQLEVEKENLQIQNEQLKNANTLLQKELDQCSKKLKAAQKAVEDALKKKQAQAKK